MFGLSAVQVSPIRCGAFQVSPFRASVRFFGKFLRLKVQLKSSYARITEHEDGSITYALEVKNYKSLIAPDRFVPLILVVFHMPREEAQWIEQTTDWLKIKKCAYWISLKGKADTDNTETVSIKIPAENLLTKDSLKEIMRKISREEEL